MAPLNKELPCHICRNLTDFLCGVCGEPVCEDCCISYTIHTQVDYPLCTICQGVKERIWEQEQEQQEKAEAIKNKKRQIRNEKARLKYNSSAERKKRQIIEERWLSKEAERRKKHIKEAANWMKEFGF